MQTTTPRSNTIPPALRELADLLERREKLESRIDALCGMSLLALRGGKPMSTVKRSRNGFYATLFRKLPAADQAWIRKIREREGFDAALGVMQREAQLAAQLGRPVSEH